MISTYYYFKEKSAAEKFYKEISAKDLSPITDAKANVIYKGIVGEEEVSGPEYMVALEFSEDDDGNIVKFLEDVKKIPKNNENDHEEEKKIDWKFWGKVALFGTACFLLGKSNRRYKEFPKKGVHFDVPGSEMWTPEQKIAVDQFVNAWNEVWFKNKLHAVIDRGTK